MCFNVQKHFFATINIPVVPGTDGPIDKNLKAEAMQIGYPIILKAASGGGGRGMRIVNDESELGDAIALTQAESKTAFGDSTIYMEKFLSSLQHLLKIYRHSMSR